MSQLPLTAETVRRDLVGDCRRAGYTPDDAERLTAKIISGLLWPGLARMPGRSEAVVESHHVGDLAERGEKFP